MTLPNQQRGFYPCFAQSQYGLENLAGETFDLLVKDSKHSYYIVYYYKVYGFLIREAHDARMENSVIVCPVNKLKEIKYNKVSRNNYIRELVDNYLLGYQRYYADKHPDVGLDVVSGSDIQNDQYY